MSRKIYDPFEKMSEKQLDTMIEIDLDSRNLKERKKPVVKKVGKATDAGNFLGIQAAKKTATA